MKKVKNGDYVKVHYTGKFENGEVFDTSSGCSPLEVHIGGSDVIPGFEDALLGMGTSEKKTFTVDATEAYGPRDENLQKSFPRSDFPDGFEAQVGQVIILQSPEEEQFPATIAGVEGDQVLLDLNHPLAGKNLTFDIEVLEINDKPTESPCNCGCSCS
jgi:peptidylprolyl isomerase